MTLINIIQCKYIEEINQFIFYYLLVIIKKSLKKVCCFNGKKGNRSAKKSLIKTHHFSYPFSNIRKVNISFQSISL